MVLWKPVNLHFQDKHLINLEPYILLVSFLILIQYNTSILHVEKPQ
jgi:hypothetical protein